MIVADTVRVMVILGGIVMIGFVLAAAKQLRGIRQFGCFSLSAFGISAIGTEIENLSNVVTYRLVFNVIGVTCGLVYLWKVHHATRLDVECET